MPTLCSPNADFHEAGLQLLPPRPTPARSLPLAALELLTLIALPLGQEAPGSPSGTHAPAGLGARAAAGVLKGLTRDPKSRARDSTSCGPHPAFLIHWVRARNWHF